MTSLNPSGNFEVYFFHQNDSILCKNLKFENAYFNDFPNEIFYQEVTRDEVAQERLSSETQQHFMLEEHLGAVHHNRCIFYNWAFEHVFTRAMNFEEIQEAIISRSLLNYSKAIIGYEITVDHGKSLNAQHPSEEFWFECEISLRPDRRLRDLGPEFFAICERQFLSGNLGSSDFV